MWLPLLREVWAALGGSPGELARVTVSGPDDTLASALPVTAVATAAIAASLLAARPTEPVELDTRQVAVAIRSERHVRLDGDPLGEPFDPLSAFFRSADGWIRLHGNYRWHKAAALGVLGSPPDADLEAVRTAVAGWPSVRLEDALHAAGGVAAAVRTPQRWRTGPAGAAVAELPLLELRHIGDAPPRPERPARVLDLTRVIAGPVATRTLAAHGAQVLRIDRPDRTESPLLLADTAPGKRSALLDLRSGAARRTLDELLRDADVVALGHRPGALDRFGLSPQRLAADQPGLVVLSLSAWGHGGPWSGRRGFDSLVQAATGIAVTESGAGESSAGESGAGESGAADGDAGAPGALPAQLLDHASGYLGAAAVLRALTEQRSTGGSWHARLSLAQTAHWLLGLPRQPVTEPTAFDPRPYLQELDTPHGRLTIAAPPGRIAGRALRWPGPPPDFGADQPRWTG